MWVLYDIYEAKKGKSLNHRFFILMKIQADMEMPEGWGYIARFALDCTWPELEDILLLVFL